MLRTSNPVLSRRDSFTPAAPQGYGQQGQFGFPPQGPADPYGQQTAPTGARMTFDDVVTKTVVTMVTLVAAAAVTWMGFATGVVPSTLMMPAMILSALVGFVTVLFVSFRRKVNPGLVLVYAAIEGVFIGLISMLFENLFNGIVPQAVLATFIAAGITLAAYKFFNIRVTGKFRKIVVIATIAYAVTMLVNFLFAIAGINLGIRGIGEFSPLMLLFSAIGVTLAVLNLVLDFDYIEQGVRVGAPASESWRAAFGLTVTMVWLYVEMLRILSYFRQ